MPTNRDPNPSDPKGNAATRNVTPSRKPSFKNHRTGVQSFQDSKIKSDSCSCVKSRIGSDRLVYNGGGGKQNFKNSTINGVKVESPTSSSKPSSSSRSETTVCCTTCQSFNNHGGGSQTFNGAVIDVSGNKGNPSLSLSIYIYIIIIGSLIFHAVGLGGRLCQHELRLISGRKLAL
ncbi:hypothetical protein VNO80_10702 [Phaseolus coccineus]|uniref:Transmembrane protein n=1 Tax=Phaseolus coccineus TaxID=3886 RepID=A0AAN9REV2_PHACN